MLKSILVAIVAICAVVIVAATGQPDTYRLEREIRIDAPADAVYAQFADLRQWPAWSPWAQRDPDMIMTYSDTSTGVGAWAAWDSTTEGKGRQTIRAAVPNERVDIELEFFAPFEGQAAADLVITPATGGVVLAWGMDGRNDGFLAKLFYLVLDLETVLGKDYDAGLQRIKLLAEQAGG